MSDESLYSKHWRLLTQDPSQMNEQDRKALEELQAIPLPPLKPLPPLQKNSNFLLQAVHWWRYAFATVAICSLAFLILLPQQETLKTKGSLRVSVYWQRNKVVKPFTAETELQTGDKIGANLISNEDSRVYWAIGNAQLHLLSEVETMDLKAGEPRDLTSSFELDASNQGEQLIVVVCPKSPNSQLSKNSQNSDSTDFVFDHSLITKLLNQKEVDASPCAYLGYRLRSQK